MAISLPRQPTKKVTVSKLVITFIALFTAISPYVADFNDPHVYNPYWPGHAKFHNGQTMTLGLISGGLSLYFLWLRKASTGLENLKMSCLFAALYWLAMFPAIAYPGATLTDPHQNGRPMDYIHGYAFTQLHIDFILVLILGACFWVESNRLTVSDQRPVPDTLTH